MSSEQSAQEPFGYWCECKGADPVFLRKPAWIPPTDERHTATPLYANPQPEDGWMSDEQGTKEMKLSKGEILFGGTALLWFAAWMAVVLVAWVVS